MSDNKIELRKQQMQIGQVAKMLEAGYTEKEITEALKLNESAVRSHVAIVKKAQAMKAAGA